MKTRPTQERLKEVFHYDPETGIFTRRSASNLPGPKDRKYGRIGAGRVTELGYVLLMIDGHNYIAAPLAWLYMHGEWPNGRMKYIDGNKLDNRISNLRVQNEDAEEIKSRTITQERLKELFHYEPATGWLTWRINSAVAKPGERAGTLHGYGYRMIGVDYKKYLEHTLVWVYMTGDYPKEIDHINGNKSDNSWNNLRLATRSQNSHNKPNGRGRNLGFPGILKFGNGYRSRIQIDGQTTEFGTHKTIAEARIARLLGEKEKFGRFTTWVEERDGTLPLGDRYIAVIVRDNCLYVLDAAGVPREVTDVKQIETIPVTEDGHTVQ